MTNQTYTNSKMTQVLVDAITAGTVVEPHDWAVALNAQRRLNTSPGWRPSDAMAYEVSRYAKIGAVAYLAEFEAERARDKAVV